MRLVVTIVCSLVLACASLAEAVVQGSGMRASGSSASPVRLGPLPQGAAGLLIRCVLDSSQRPTADLHTDLQLQQGNPPRRVRTR